ncbi:MAG TPA: NAD-dependent epimerase/dehydratase family protein [Devosiaceae bacterium]|nr:NAD-dependent epimerase/dehydratase family protein [Devosiaceae bacterium]
MQKVLVTGGCGFIGRYLVKELLQEGYRVRVLDSLIEQVHGGAAIPPEIDGAELLRADIRDPVAVREALVGVEGVFHLAAEVGVGQSMYEIARYVGTNDLGTAVLLEEMIDAPPRRIVVASSMSVYGEGLYARADGTRLGNVRRSLPRIKAGEWDPEIDGDVLRPVPTDEQKPVDLASIYALTKYNQERAVQIFGEAYGIETVALRLFNVFGPGQALSNPYTGVLANFGSRLMNGQPPLIFEDGRQKRDFVHVKDVARAFRLAMEQKRAPGHVINVGSGRAYPIAEVAMLLAEAMDVPEIVPEILGKARAGDIRNCFADISRARELLGFSPQYQLEKTVGEMADWVRESTALDRSAEMQRQLLARGLVT